MDHFLEEVVVKRKRGMQSLALVLAAGVSRSTAFRMSVPAKAPALAKTLFAPKQTPKEPIAPQRVC